ncbi:hypothetical protein KV102_16720 [Mumia sp. zg.B53]|uniref:hypothetical protein n=1 Tax=unclassified Mumia TaxID=2621872 RepID=UPI001C6DE80C|nr:MULTISPECIES: hypothetical protein [unclassified Mumia]MBW9205472.1 hypothetical protein [Mumia sp. zg.B17]MBW9208526.1 hypothetical protein [Mumia sp. zg.B21]MBW9216485.1 hypothetical protein [Mumia sp. zg.B53]MDD9347192.1 hypothetical protein [Mumia sp.]
MSDFESESYDTEAPLDDDGPEERLTPDPELDPTPRVDVDEVDPDADAAEADQVEQAWEVALDDDFDRG